MRGVFAVESRLRRWLRDAGAWLESRLGRERNRSDLRDLAGEMIPKLQEALDRSAQAQEESETLWVGGDIVVLLDYNTFAQLEPSMLAALAEDLREAAEEMIANRRYETDSVSVRVSYDPMLAAPIVRVTGTRPARPQAKTEVPSLSQAAAAGTPSGLILKSLSPEVPVSFPLHMQHTKRTIVSVGRSADNALPVEHQSISKFHATIGIDPDGTVAVADIGSTNGTFVNRARLHGRTSLHPGDVVTLGEIDFRLEQQ